MSIFGCTGYNLLPQYAPKRCLSLLSAKDKAIRDSIFEVKMYNCNIIYSFTDIL